MKIWMLEYQSSNAPGSLNQAHLPHWRIPLEYYYVNYISLKYISNSWTGRNRGFHAKKLSHTFPIIYIIKIVRTKKDFPGVFEKYQVPTLTWCSEHETSHQSHILAHLSTPNVESSRPGYLTPSRQDNGHDCLCCYFRLVTIACSQSVLSLFLFANGRIYL